MIEFDVDMGYLLEYDELDKVVLNDENGEHEPMEFVPKDAATEGVETCRGVVCNQSDCVHNREYRCACTDLEIQDQECMTYRCRDIDYDEEEE